MSVLDSFYEKFIDRHDFEDSDIAVFMKRWKKKVPIIENIPVAWIVPLETMMFELNKRNYRVNSISQKYGQLITTVPADDNAVNALSIIERYREQIEDIDKDIYSLFSIDIRKEYFTKEHNDLVEKFHSNSTEDSN